LNSKINDDETKITISFFHLHITKYSLSSWVRRSTYLIGCMALGGHITAIGKTTVQSHKTFYLQTFHPIAVLDKEW